MKGSRISSRRRKKPQDQQKARKVANIAKMAKKSYEKLKSTKNSQIKKLSLNQLPLTLSMQSLPLR
jgi:hypothetical protein